MHRSTILLICHEWKAKERRILTAILLPSISQEKDVYYWWIFYATIFGAAFVQHNSISKISQRRKRIVELFLKVLQLSMQQYANSQLNSIETFFPCFSWSCMKAIFQVWPWLSLVSLTFKVTATAFVRNSNYLLQRKVYAFCLLHLRQSANWQEKPRVSANISLAYTFS